jgi:hypothetical protein
MSFGVGEFELNQPEDTFCRVDDIWFCMSQPWSAQHAKASSDQPATAFAIRSKSTLRFRQIAFHASSAVMPSSCLHDCLSNWSSKEETEGKI